MVDEICIRESVRVADGTMEERTDTGKREGGGAAATARST